MTLVEVPPRAEFDGLAGLLDVQRDHLARLAGYAAARAGDTRGLDNALAVLRAPAAALSGMLRARYAAAAQGITDTAAKLRAAGAAYQHADARAEAAVAATFPAAYATFPEIAGGPSLGSYADLAVRPRAPRPAEDALAASLSHVTGVVGEFEALWRWCSGGDSLLARLVTPITGDYGRLAYLRDAYAQLSDASYTVAGTLRRGTFRMAPRWNGMAATEFEWHMFRWHMGIGGLGDLARVASDVLRDGYHAVAIAVDAVLDAISALVDHELRALAEEVGLAAAGTAAIEVVGGGPEDPVADVLAAGWDAYQGYRMYRTVRRIAATLVTIDGLIRGVRHAVAGLGRGLHELALLREASADPGRLARDLLDRGLDRSYEIERQAAWDPRYGALRVALLPDR